MFRSLPSAAFSSSTACPGSPPAPARRHSLADLGPSGIQLLSSHIASEVAGSGGYHSCGPASPPLHASLPHHRFHPLQRGDIPLRPVRSARVAAFPFPKRQSLLPRSEEHTSELQSLMRISYAVFCLKKKNP